MTEKDVVSRIGVLRRVDPSTVWRNERHFSAWLKDNIGLLSDEVGLDIDLVETEVRIGGFAADLVGREAATKNPVAIENQLSRTDHDHLGKLLTYASGVDAGTLIWIATEIRDEHRQTLEWLNRVSREGVYFFGIELQPIQVDDSLPAPHFNIVVGPPAIKTPPVEQVTPRMQSYHDFFSDLLEKLKARKPGITSASKVGYDSWFGLSAGRTGFGISITFAQRNRFRVELYIDTGDREKNKGAFDALLESRTDIEKSLGADVAWERLDAAQASRMAVYWPESVNVLEAESKLNELKDWAIETADRFKQVLGPRIAEL